MRAMLLTQTGPFQARDKPLTLTELPLPVPKSNEVRIHITVCGVCHTELDELEGRTAPPQLPVVLSHQVIGRVDTVGEGRPG